MVEGTAYLESRQEVLRRDAEGPGWIVALENVHQPQVVDHDVFVQNHHRFLLLLKRVNAGLAQIVEGIACSHDRTVLDHEVRTLHLGVLGNPQKLILHLHVLMTHMTRREMSLLNESVISVVLQTT